MRLCLSTGNLKRLMQKPSESPRSFVSMTKLLGAIIYGRAKMITAPLRQKNTNKKG